MIKDKMEEYLNDPGIGSSKLKMILQSPKDFLYQNLAKAKESASQTKGTLWHSYLLERDLYLEEHAIQPEDWGPLNQNPGKKKWDEFKKSAKENNKTPVKFSEAGDLLLLDEEMKKHKKFQEILKCSQAEVSFYGDFNGVRLKSREDLYDETTGTIYDVKTTSKPIDDESLAATIYKNGYHFSAYHHMLTVKLAGHKVKDWGWIFVSTATPAPHIIIKKASKQFLKAGKTDWLHAFMMLKACKKDNHWPGYSEDIEEIDLPDWAEKFYN